MHWAICSKVLGQTHMRYVLKHIGSNFLKIFTFYVFFGFFTHTKLKHKSKIKKQKQCIQRNARYTKCMKIWHSMHEGSYKDWKN